MPPKLLFTYFVVVHRHIRALDDDDVCLTSVVCSIICIKKGMADGINSNRHNTLTGETSTNRCFPYCILGCWSIFLVSAKIYCWKRAWISVLPNSYLISMYFSFCAICQNRQVMCFMWRHFNRFWYFPLTDYSLTANFLTQILIVFKLYDLKYPCMVTSWW